MYPTRRSCSRGIIGVSGRRSMLQCTRTVAGVGRAACAPPCCWPCCCVLSVPVCTPSTSMFSGNTATCSIHDRSLATLSTAAKSGVLPVYSLVTSMTAALSGPYASMSKLARIAPRAISETAR